jgi:phosphoglycerate dehydrogenase-like enzyme
MNAGIDTRDMPLGGRGLGKGFGGVGFLMISRSDYIVVAETLGMIGEPELAAMKPEAVVIKVGRGPAIDEAALIKALFEKRIKGAAPDVSDIEPLPEGRAFYNLENVLLSPHCADRTPDWMD